MLVALVLLACTGHEDTGAPAAPPSVAWLTPRSGDVVSAGDLACSVVVDDFTLADPAKHSEGSPEGYLAIQVDGAEVLTTSSTGFTLSLAAGPHDLTAALFFLDGDVVSASATALCDEDSTDAACAPVAATLSLTAS